MSIYLQDDSVVLNGGSVATSSDCCCNGVCCDCEGNCDDTITQEDCESSGGQWFPDDTCDDNPCDALTKGACCNDTDCTVKTQVCCENAGGEYQGDDTTCDPNPCAPTGACCDSEGNCTITTEEECAGTYQGDDTVCDPNPCGVVDCPCGYTGLTDPYTRFLSLTYTLTRTETRGDPFLECTSSWNYTWIKTIDPVTCEETIACSGGGTITDDSGTFPWNWVSDPSNPTGCFGDSGAGQGLFCNATCAGECFFPGNYTNISSNTTAECPGCTFSVSGYDVTISGTLELYNQCNPT